jgi:hypothetical protein
MRASNASWPTSRSTSTFSPRPCEKCMVRPRSASETPALRVGPRQCIRPVGGACPLAGHDG